MTALAHYIQTYFGASNDELKHISMLFKSVHLTKGSFFVKAGGIADRLGFVQSGILREFIEVNDQEVTKWISTQGYFAVDLQGFIFGQPARWNIQALTDTEVYVIDLHEYHKIKEIVPRWTELEKRFIAKCFNVMEDRIVQHLCLSAEERYQKLFAFNKELFNQVPLQYLASMLGMTPETLSRIRKKTTPHTS